MDGHDDHSAVQDEDPDDGIRVFPRRKLHEAEHGKVYSEPVRGRPPMTLSLKTVELLFDLPQKDVAARFGISLTAFKQVCRKLGITRWPYRRASKVMEVLTCKLPYPYSSLVMIDCAPDRRGLVPIAGTLTSLRHSLSLAGAGLGTRGQSRS